MDRALREFRIRGVATNLAFLETIINHPSFRDNTYTTGSSTRRRSCSSSGQAAGPRDQAADLHRRRHRQRPSRDARPAAAARPTRARAGGARSQRHRRRPAAKQLLDELGPEAFADWMREQKQVLVTDTTMRDGAPVAARDAHAHATTSPASPAPMRAALPQLLSLECWGGATFDVAMRFLTEDPWERLRAGARGGAQPADADAAARRQRRRLHQLSRQCRAAFRQRRRRQAASTCSASSTA